MLVECRLNCGGSRLQESGKLFKVLAGMFVTFPDDTHVGWGALSRRHLEHHIRGAGGCDEREEDKERKTKLHVGSTDSITMRLEFLLVDCVMTFLKDKIHVVNCAFRG